MAAMTALALLHQTRRLWPLAAAGAALALLLGAHLFEWFGGMDPCPLCILQRNVLWATVAIAIPSALLWGRDPSGAGARLACVLLAGAFLTGAAIAAFHAGVEWKWWKGPPCAVVETLPSPEDIFKRMQEGGPTKQPCDAAAWRDPVTRLSMAGWNALISAGLAAASVWAALRPDAQSLARHA